MLPRRLLDILARLEPGVKYQRLNINSEDGSGNMVFGGQCHRSSPISSFPKWYSIWHHRRIRSGFIGALLLLLIMIAFGQQTVSTLRSWNHISSYPPLNECPTKN